MKNQQHYALPLSFIQRTGWLHRTALLLCALAFFSACQKKAKHNGAVTLAQAPIIPNPQEGEAKPILGVKLPDLIRINRETLIKAQTTAAVSWDWTQVSGPGFILFQSPSAKDTSVRADKDGVYTIRLTVRDSEGLTAANDMVIQWDTEAPALFLSQEIRSFQSLVIDAKVGSDAEKIEWTQISGPGTLVFGSKDARSTKVTASQDGSYVIRLKASDDLGNEGFADLQFIWDTIAPSVTVGQDRVTNQEIILDATTADATSFQWSKISGPGVISFGSPIAEDTTVKASTDGSYVLRLTTTKASGATSTDEMNLVWDTTPPVVSLGMDRISRYRATIDANTEDALSFRWSQKSGPGVAVFSLPNSEDSSITSNLAGDYEVELNVTDWAGNTAADRLIISFEYDLRVLAKQVIGGGSSTCAILDDNELSCWGYNYEGELGYGDNKDRYMPPSFGLNLGSGKTAIAMAAGYSHNCAILNDRSVKCWGQNTFGQLGYNDQVPRGLTPNAPINLGAARTAKAIATGFAHSCAILDDNSLKCWGANSSGQLGYGDFSARLTPSASPINLGEGRTAKAISLGSYHSCALLDNNSIKCWGNNSEGQLGYGDKLQRSAPPANSVAFTGSLPATSISTGHFHSCAVLSDKSLRCWGRNSEGQLGYGDNTLRLAPAANAVDFGTGLNLASVSTGLAHSCALFDEGSIQCWGANDEGQLGYGDNINRMAPTQSSLVMAEGRVARSLSAGRLHTCALLDDSTLKCWGSNSYGQLGTGKTVNQTAVPAKVIEYGNKTSTLVLRQ